MSPRLHIHAADVRVGDRVRTTSGWREVIAVSTRPAQAPMRRPVTSLQVRTSETDWRPYITLGYLDSTLVDVMRGGEVR